MKQKLGWVLKQIVKIVLQDIENKKILPTVYNFNPELPIPFVLNCWDLHINYSCYRLFHLLWVTPIAKLPKQRHCNELHRYRFVRFKCTGIPLKQLQVSKDSLRKRFRTSFVRLFDKVDVCNRQCQLTSSSKWAYEVVTNGPASHHFSAWFWPFGPTLNDVTSARVSFAYDVIKAEGPRGCWRHI